MNKSVRIFIPKDTTRKKAIIGMESVHRQVFKGVKKVLTVSNWMLDFSHNPQLTEYRTVIIRIAGKETVDLQFSVKHTGAAARHKAGHNRKENSVGRWDALNNEAGYHGGAKGETPVHCEVRERKDAEGDDNPEGDQAISEPLLKRDGDGPQKAAQDRIHTKRRRGGDPPLQPSLRKLLSLYKIALLVQSLLAAFSAVALSILAP